MGRRPLLLCIYAVLRTQIFIILTALMPLSVQCTCQIIHASTLFLFGAFSMKSVEVVSNYDDFQYRGVDSYSKLDSDS